MGSGERGRERGRKGGRKEDGEGERECRREGGSTVYTYMYAYVSLHRAVFSLKKEAVLGVYYLLPLLACRVP